MPRDLAALFPAPDKPLRKLTKNELILLEFLLQGDSVGLPPRRSNRDLQSLLLMGLVTGTPLEYPCYPGGGFAYRYRVTALGVIAAETY